MTPQTSIVRLRGAIRHLRKVWERMESQDIDALLTVYLKPGITLTDLQDEVGLSQAAISRLAYRLSHEERPGEPGLNLFQIEVDGVDRRRRQVFLSPKGQKVVQAMAEQLN